MCPVGPCVFMEKSHRERDYFILSKRNENEFYYSKYGFTFFFLFSIFGIIVMLKIVVLLSKVAIVW